MHCKMGISRSGSSVIAYAMKQQRWSLETALAYVRERRAVVKPNEGFMRQLHTYNGILNARSDLILSEDLHYKMMSRMPIVTKEVCQCLWLF